MIQAKYVRDRQTPKGRPIGYADDTGQVKSTQALIAITGHASLSEIQRYTKAADQKRARAIGDGKGQIANINCQTYGLV